jgi:hypothetical protein
MTPPASSSCTLLLSDFALRTWGARIAAAVPPDSLSFVTAETAVAADGPCVAEIAFMTREVTGRNGCRSTRPAPSGRCTASCASAA